MPDKDPFDHVVDCPGHYLHGAHVAIIGPCINMPSAVWVESQRGSIDWVYRNQAKPLPQPVKVWVHANTVLAIAAGERATIDYCTAPGRMAFPERWIELTITPEQIEAARKAVGHG